MKRYLYLIGLLVSFASLTACDKNNDPAPDPIIGTWKLDKIRTSGFVAPYTSLNVDADPALSNTQDIFTLNSDKTFTGTYRSPAVYNYSGTWSFASPTLTVKDPKGNSETYTLDQTKTPAQLLTGVYSMSKILTNPTTNKQDTVKYTTQSIYVKQP